MPVAPRILLAAVLGLAPSLAVAQTATPASQAQPAPQAQPVQVDTSALAYYAARHDTPRVEAELRRLRSLYPNWQPPADPASLAVVTDGPSEDKPLWDLFGADKLDELDAAIAKRKSDNPDWVPPAELVAKLDAKRARFQLDVASDRKDYAAVIDIAAKNPALVTPDDLDVSWRVADAYGRTGASDKALKLNASILETVNDPAARLATVRKAMASLPPAELDKLIGMGHRDPGGKSEFDAVDLDLVRQRVGRVLAGNATETAAPQDLARLEASARGPGGISDAVLLGWWNSKHQDWQHANDWFQMALKAGPSPAAAKPEDAKVAQGAALALRGIGRNADAEALAYQWREADPALALLYIDSVDADLTRPKPVPLEADRLKRFTDVVLAQQSGDGAQALGWYAYNVGQFKPAQLWFEKAMAWQPRDTTALGLALSLKQLDDKPALAAFLAEKGPTFPALAALSADKPTPGRQPTPRRQRASAPPSEEAMPRVRPTRRTGVPAGARRASSSCPSGPPRIDSIDRVEPRAALQLGWCLMSLDRPQEAAIAFAAAGGRPDTGADAAYGQALAQLRNKRTGEAVMAASSAALTSTRRNEIGLAALAQTAASTFDQGRYEDTLKALNQRRRFVTEPRDLAILRAWSNYHTGHLDRARSMFTDLDKQLSTTESRSGMAQTVESSRQ